jgi:hypothetical protein
MDKFPGNLLLSCLYLAMKIFAVWPLRVVNKIVNFLTIRIEKRMKNYEIL